jgi:hypothetical protein
MMKLLVSTSCFAVVLAAAPSAACREDAEPADFAQTGTDSLKHGCEKMFSPFARPSLASS